MSSESCQSASNCASKFQRKLEQICKLGQRAKSTVEFVDFIKWKWKYLYSPIKIFSYTYCINAISNIKGSECYAKLVRFLNNNFLL